MIHLTLLIALTFTQVSDQMVEPEQPTQMTESAGPTVILPSRQLGPPLPQIIQGQHYIDLHLITKPGDLIATSKSIHAHSLSQAWAIITTTGNSHPSPIEVVRFRELASQVIIIGPFESGVLQISIQIKTENITWLSGVASVPVDDKSRSVTARARLQRPINYVNLLINDLPSCASVATGISARFSSVDHPEESGSEVIDCTFTPGRTSAIVEIGNLSPGKWMVQLILHNSDLDPLASVIKMITAETTTKIIGLNWTGKGDVYRA